MEKKVSVIVPAYNAESSIKKCLDSILGQTIKDIEVIVIDDCSQDKTLEILKKYGKRIVLLSNDNNMGPAASRNRGLDVASGEYIGFVDADDYIDKDMYKTMLKHMKGDVDLVCCSRYNVVKGQEKAIINTNKSDNPKEFSKTTNYNVDKLFKKSIIDKYHLRLPEQYRYAEDFAFNIRYKYYAQKMVILENPFYYYFYDNENSITNSYDESILDIVRVLDDMVLFFKEESAFEENKNELLEISIGFYVRRIKEFRRYNNITLQKKFVQEFLQYFKRYFKDYKKKINYYQSSKSVFYRSNYWLMCLFIYKQRLKNIR